MPLKLRKPITPGQRGMSFISFDEITKSKPEKKLLRVYKRSTEELISVLLYVEFTWEFLLRLPSLYES